MSGLGLLFLYFLCAGRGRGATPAPAPAPVPRRPAAAAQPPLVMTRAPASTAPWPQQLPPGLPPYPGPDWITDLPPTPGVPQRAAQLLPMLWREGEGAYRIEQTGGKWIAYRATQMGVKRGVTAKRLRTAAPAPATTRVAPATTRVAPEPRQAPTDARVLKVKLPGGGTVRIPEVRDTEGRRVPNVPTAPPAPRAAKPAPKRAPASPLSLPTLRLRSPYMRGPDVVTLQSKLGGIEADGVFGPMTHRAVLAFQGSRGLVQDGIVGPKTWAALYG